MPSFTRIVELSVRTLHAYLARNKPLMDNGIATFHVLLFSVVVVNN